MDHIWNDDFLFVCYAHNSAAFFSSTFLFEFYRFLSLVNRLKFEDKSMFWWKCNDKIYIENWIGWHIIILATVFLFKKKLFIRNVFFSDDAWWWSISFMKKKKKKIYRTKLVISLNHEDDDHQHLDDDRHYRRLFFFCLVCLVHHDPIHIIC